MSVSQGGRSLRNRAPIDYTSCFYKSKLSRDEPRSQKSDEQTLLASRPRKKKQKLSHESISFPGEFSAEENAGDLQQRASGSKEPEASDGQPNHKRDKKTKKKKSEREISRRSDELGTEEDELAELTNNQPADRQPPQASSPAVSDPPRDRNSKERQSASRKSKLSQDEPRTEQSNQVDGEQAARKREKKSKKQKRMPFFDSVVTSPVAARGRREQSDNSCDLGDEGLEAAGARQELGCHGEPQQQHAPFTAGQEDAAVQRLESPNPLPLVPQARSGKRAAAAPDSGREEEVVGALFGEASPAPPARQHNVAKLATMWDQTLKTRLDAANKYSSSLEKQMQALVTTNAALEAELKHRDDELAATIDQFSQEKSRVVKNYRRLYARFQEIRSHQCEDIDEVLDSVWDAIEDHNNTADTVCATWKQEAVAQKNIVEECAAEETLQRMQTLEEDNLNLKAQVLDEGHMVMLATQEINELKSLIEVLRAGKPTTADFGCTAAPETADVACGLGKGAQWDGMLSPIAAARARRRTDLGVNRLACDLVPEGVDVQSLDTAVLRLGLIKPTDPSELPSIPPFQQQAELEQPEKATESGTPDKSRSPSPVCPKGVPSDSPLQQQILPPRSPGNDLKSPDAESVRLESGTAGAAGAQAAAKNAPDAVAIVGSGGASPGGCPVRLPCHAAHAAAAAAHAMHRITPPQLGTLAGAGIPLDPEPEVHAEAPAPPGAKPEASLDAEPAPQPRKTAGQNRASNSTVEQGGQDIVASTGDHNEAGAAQRACLFSPKRVAPLRDATRKVHSNPLPVHTKPRHKPKEFHHLILASHPDQENRKVRARDAENPDAALEHAVGGAVPILSPVEEEQDADLAQQSTTVKHLEQQCC